MRAVNHTLHLGTATLLVMALGSYVFASEASGSPLRNLSYVNRSIEVNEEQRVGKVSTVNGDVVIQAGAVARQVDTVNGDVELEDNSAVDSADTVNGRIEVGKNVRVGDSLETVNGSITVRERSEVGGHVRTVNGDIELYGARANDQLRTANGDIRLREGTVVAGDIIFRANTSWLNNLFSFGRDHRPTLFIDADSVVEGSIHLYREVELRIHADARVKEIIEHF